MIPATPAAFADFEAGETITKIETETVNTWQDARWLLLSQCGGEIAIRDCGNPEPNGEDSYGAKWISAASSADDLEADFLKKIGLSIYQPAMKPIISKLFRIAQAIALVCSQVMKSSR